jgi:enamine deaminase RidA (YjgF/YER057c/UK114 family)
MTNPQFLNPPEIHVPGGYSHAVTVSGQLLIVSGQVAFDKDRKIVGNGDFEAQAAQAFENVRCILAAAGARFENVVRLGAFLTDRKYLPVFREVRARYFSGSMPASTAVIAGLILPELLVEIEATAQLPG